MNLLTVDFGILMSVVIGAFALGGFIRGWWREGLTTILLLLLVLFLTQPGIVTNIIDYVNNLLEVFGLVVETGGDLSLERIQAASVTAEPPTIVDPSSRNFYIILLVVLILISYFGSRLTLPGSTVGGYQPSNGARIIGAIVGAFNGFIVVNLFKEYIIGRQIPGTGVAAQAAAPSTLSIQIAQVPPESVFSGPSLLLIIAAGIIILAFVLSSRVVAGPHIGTRDPVGYTKIE